MNRKEFIKNMAGVSASLYATSTFAGPIASSATENPNDLAGKQNSNIKRGVTFYSYQEEFHAGIMTLEDCITELSDIGAYGIEMPPDMMIRNFPHVPNEWLDRWFGLMDKYHTTPVCYTQMQDRRSDVNELKEDILLAKKLAFKLVRVLIQNTDIDVFEKCIPFAEENDIWLGVELHKPFAIDGPQMNEFLELIERTRTNHFGFVPDTGIFDARPNIIQRDRQVRNGNLTKDIASFIEDSWLEKLPREKVEARVQRMKPKLGDLQYIDSVYSIQPNDPRALIPHMSKIKHIHGKFYGMTEDFQEPVQDSEKIISALKEGGYDGYICSEYEGQRHIMDVSEPVGCEQVRRHHVMLKNLIDRTIIS